MDKLQRTEFEIKLQEIEVKLVDLKARWPAHSLKPALMIELEDLEEESDRLKKLLTSD